MGHVSIVYGRIRGSVLPGGGPHYFDLQSHNRAVVNRLPPDDDWPFLIRAMFGIARPPGPRGQYRAQVIHLGASMKEVECEWPAWLAKFEALLARLYFDDAVVHLETDFRGTHTYRWTAVRPAADGVDTRRIGGSDGRVVAWPRLPRPWTFEGGPRDLGC